MKRVFFPGEEWLYLRLYLGPETAEYWLANILPSLLAELENQGMVKKCFYLRYLDPAFHLRIRFEIIKPEFFGPVVQMCQEYSKDLYEEKLIWKVEIGSYDRELERFGNDWIEAAENIFTFDTRFWLSILPELYDNDEGENKRWQVALLSAHGILIDFAFPIESRIELVTKMVDTLSHEIGGGKKLRLQIDEKFRKSRSQLENILVDSKELKLPVFINAINNRSDSIKNIPAFEESVKSWDSKLRETRIADLIHLSLNRGLRSRHRMQELVLYSFLKQLYVSARARSVTNQG